MELSTSIFNPNRKSPPDFSFPPRYPSNTPESPALTPQPRTKSRPIFDFPFYLTTQLPQSEPEIKTPHPPSPATNTTKTTSTSRSRFLTLPLEIRLQIYHEVLLQNPVSHPHLAPLPSPSCSSKTSSLSSSTAARNYLKPASLFYPSYPSSSPSAATHQPQPQPHPQNQNQNQTPSKIPTPLLLTNHQIFAECKLLAFQTNDFTFVNWFSSGVYAAGMFMGGLREWQAEGVRWVGVQVLGRDLGVGVDLEGEGGAKEWGELCEFWEGVWGLRLCVKMKGGFAGEGGEGGLLSVDQEWVVDGLSKLKSLRWLELKLDLDLDQDFEGQDEGREDEEKVKQEMRREKKVQFSTDLETIFDQQY